MKQTFRRQEDNHSLVSLATTATLNLKKALITVMRHNVENKRYVIRASELNRQSLEGLRQTYTPYKNATQPYKCH